MWNKQMLKICRSSQFKKDLKKIIKQNKELKKLEEIIVALQHQKPLQLKNNDHILTGNWFNYRECHICSDWLLIYKIEKQLRLLRLARTGSHSDLFK